MIIPINDIAKIVIVYDVEIFPNVFSCTLKNSETLEVIVFEVSHRCSDVKEEVGRLVHLFLNHNYLFCGYNNIHYDNPIINFIIEGYSIMPNDYIRVCATLFDLSRTIITSDNPDKWKRWKYAHNFDTLDLLTMLFSQKLRVGLKEMQVTMRYPNVQEYHGKFDDWLPDDEIDEMLSYNLNDVDSTLELLNRCKDDIDLRIGIQKEFGINVLSMDGMTIGNEILKTKYLEKTHKQWSQIKDNRSPCDEIDLSNIIFSFIKFDTPLLQDILDDLKKQVVNPGRKGYEKHFLYDGVEITIGVGGIHTKNKAETIKPKDNERLLDSDVASLYPSLIIAYDIIPPHLESSFSEIYGQLRIDRLIAKRNKQQIKNQTYKLALNGASGNYQNEYNWMYSPESVMRIRMNGQLLLIMLAERIVMSGGHIKQLNTDGVLYTFPKDVPLEPVLKEWEDLTKLELETEEYEVFYQFAVNDYLAIGKGYSQTKDKKLLKKKGLFIDKVTLGKGMQPMIIPKAINAYLADGIPVEETVMSSRDINDFITYQKVDKKFSVEYNNEIIGRINRYYMSTGGYYLYKCIVDGDERTQYTNMLKASGVVIVNNLNNVVEFPKDVNYRYYIKECNKIIVPLQTVQTSLFDLWDGFS